MPVSIDLPAAREVASLTMSDGAEILLRRHGNPDRYRLVLSHGNGLAIDGYAPFWLRLLEDFDVVVYDQRNHGQNPFHSLENHTYDRVAQDQGEIIAGIREKFGSRPMAGIMHSLSTLANVRYWVAFGPHKTPPWDGLVLVDMPMMPPPGHPLQDLHREDMKIMSGRAARRPTDYADPSELAGRLAGRPEFEGWPPGAADLIARATLRHDPASNRWHLACPRECETRFFTTNLDPVHWERLNEIDVPLLLLGADPTTPWAQAPAKLTEALAEESGRPYHMLPGTSHMLQIEQPELAVGLIKDFLKRHGLVT